LCDETLLSWGWLNTCLLIGISELIPCFVLLACTALALIIKLALSQAMSFLVFTLLSLPCIPLRGVSKWLCGAELPAGVKP